MFLRGFHPFTRRAFKLNDWQYLGRAQPTPRAEAGVSDGEVKRCPVVELEGAVWSSW